MTDQENNDPETVTGFKPGQKLLYLTEFGGQPQMRIVTFAGEVEVGRPGDEYDAITVQEFDGYIEYHQVHTFDAIAEMFNSYDEKERRRWRAIHDGIIPAVMLTGEEIDKIIDKNEEWLKKWEEMQKEWERSDAEDQRRSDAAKGRVRKVNDSYVKGRVYKGGFIFPEEQEGIVVVRSIEDIDKLDSAKETDIVYIDLENIFQEGKEIVERGRI